jgi:hypothetical protein
MRAMEPSYPESVAGSAEPATDAAPLAEPAVYEFGPFVVDMQQQLYMSLAQAHEQARLDEVRSTPVIGLIDAPEGSIRRNGGNYIRSAIIGLIFGVILGTLLALWREYFERFRVTQPKRYSEFREALAVISPRKRRLQKR